MEKAACAFVAALGLLGCKASGSGSGNCATDWTAIRGTQEADGPGCAPFIGTSAEVNPTFDWWGASFNRKVEPKGTALKIEATFSRPLEDGDRPVDLHFRGGYFGVAQNKYYFWEGDGEPPKAAPNPHWTDWQKTNVDVHQETVIAVRQKGADLEGFIDGALVGTFKLNSPPSPGPVGIGFKSAQGKAAKVKFRNFTVTEL
jgi:hypothetical protein